MLTKNRLLVDGLSCHMLISAHNVICQMLTKAEYERFFRHEDMDEARLLRFCK